MKTLLVIVASLLFAYALAFGLTLFIGHRGGWMVGLILLGVFAVGLTLWLLRDELPHKSRRGGS
jgi:hypothetical protein